ncbi:MAG: protoporphyrinogen oxidase, partial [Acidimicrobiales bacterium]
MGTTVAVVGGGIAGLAAAWELSGGAGGPGPDTPQVVVLEAGGRLGGKLRSPDFDGAPVDVGPDGFLGRRPEAAALCRELDLGDDLVPIGTSGAAVWARGRPRPLPGGLYMGIPTRFFPVARSGILGAGGTLRLLVDVVAPRRDRHPSIGDRALGPLVAARLGPAVVDRLVDPLVGGIHAGGVEAMSSAAVLPLLLAVAPGRTGLMRAIRQASAKQDGNGNGNGNDGGAHRPPAFWALRRGLGSLTDRLVTRLGRRGVSLRTTSPVELVDRRRGPGPPWVLHTPEGPVVADGMVLALPAGPAATLLAPHDDDATTLLRGIEYASVVVVTMAFPAHAVPTDLYGTGLLVPTGSPAPASGGLDGTFLVTACTYLSTKWPHLARPGSFLVRASVGRFGDDRAGALDNAALVARVASELRVLLGITADPLASEATRWPDAFPQYRVHHLLRVAAIDSALTRLPAVAAAGGAYRGVGIPACVAGGRTAARTVLEALGTGPAPGTPA